jgi:hypothetical protein
MDKHTLDLQTSLALTALATALCKQSSIDGQQLRLDFLDILEGISQSPENVGAVGKNIAYLMDSLLRAGGQIPPPGWNNPEDKG